MHGGDIYDKDIRLDFSVNINPLGMPESVLQAAMRGVAHSTQYPDVRNSRLRALFSERWEVPEESLFFGNGAAELLMTVLQSDPTDRVILPIPSFQEYERATVSIGSEISWILLSEEKKYVLGEEELQQILKEAEDAKNKGQSVAVLLGNPNNPTGQCVPREILQQLSEAAEEKKFRLMIDESFLPFVPDEETRTMRKTAAGSDQVVVLRSMTKIYGMPGLRAGVLVSGNRTLLENMEKKTQPWRLSLPAQLAMEAAIQEPDWIEKTIRLMEDERTFLTEGLSRGLTRKILAGDAPFLLVEPTVPDLKERLLREGILIRDCQNFRGMGSGYVRLGIRTREENETLLNTWRNIV